MNSDDTGARVRALYEPDGGTAGVFSPKVADYVASRPDYPAPLFDALREHGQLQPGSTVADVGAGTGLLTQSLLARHWHVVAVEPNAGMRAAADRQLAAVPGYRSADGTAEALPLPAASVDLVTAAQAFHWFDVQQARAECLRVLRPRGHVALVWNDRLLADPLHMALDEVFAQFGGAKRGALLAHEERRDVPAFFGAAGPTQLSWPHAHALTEAGLLSLVFSRSYMPARDSAEGQEAGRRVAEVFRRFAVAGRVAVRYTTVLIIGRPRA